MPKHFLWAIALVALASSIRADDALPTETVEAVKKATVFIRVDGDGWGASGSGFVISADTQAVLIATNHHVIADDTPARVRGGGKPPFITVVFDSGTKTERSYTAIAVVGSDSERDLAILRVTGVKGVPKPIAFTDAPKLTETMPVYSFGFPFGKALAADSKTSPAVTVGKASISSFRNGPDGELQTIQIDGNLNPGNSGGPVVDAKGKLVGVAVATLKNGQGIGFIVPSGELGQMMRGRVGPVRVQTQKAGDQTTARVEVALIDPLGSLRAASVRYLLVPPNAKRPEGDSLDKVTGSKKVELKVDKGTAVAEIPVTAAEGEIVVQVSVESSGKTTTTRPRAFPLSPSGGGTLTGTPPAGWKEYAPWDRSFVIWVPEKPASQTDHDKTRAVNGHLFSVKAVIGKTTSGLIYEGQMIRLPLAMMRADRRELQDQLRDVVASEIDGKVTDTKEVKFGAIRGSEHLIEAGRKAIRVRLWVFASDVYLVQVTGTTEQMTGTEAETILNSFRPPFADVQARAQGGGPGEVISPTAKASAVFGGAGGPPFGGPLFKDTAPPGGLLVGVEVVIGRPYGDELVRSLRPIYRVGDKESFGKQFGTVLDPVLTLKAKPGYAVGGVTAKARNVCDGFSLTFMKVVDGRLDPKDSYESEWVGWNGRIPAAKAMSDGTPVVGLAGRTNEKDVAGIGLVFKGQEKTDGGAAPAPAAAVGPAPAWVKGKEPTILGGAFDPQFVELVPEGGLLVGFEVGLAPAFGRTMTRSLRPIYRVGDKETFGEQRGTQHKSTVVLKAEAGYAVGGVSVMHGLGFDGLTVKFMKVVDGKLDPKDSYDADYVGSNEKKPLTTLGGDGTPVVGIVGKSNGTDLTGFGLLFKGQEPQKK